MISSFRPVNAFANRHIFPSCIFLSGRRNDDQCRCVISGFSAFSLLSSAKSSYCDCAQYQYLQSGIRRIQMIATPLHKWPRPGIALAVILGLLCALSGSRILSAPQNASAQINPKLFQALRYRNIGPHRGGRVTAVAGHRRQPHTFYMGATGGGVWKTTDAGQSWQNVSDGYFETASIGAIAVAESDPNVIYVGTGSAAIRSNVILGRGVYKSSDAGKTWMHA